MLEQDSRIEAHQPRGIKRHLASILWWTTLATVTLVGDSGDHVSGPVGPPFLGNAIHGLPYFTSTRAVRIEREVRELGDHPWAGSYYAGDGFIERHLLLAPGTGYVNIVTGCLGVYGVGYGDVEPQSDGAVRLQAGRGGVADEFIPIRWGRRTYLVERSEMLKFVEAVNLGSEPESLSRDFFLRANAAVQCSRSSIPRISDESHVTSTGAIPHCDDSPLQTDGTPELPAEYAKLLVPRPIRARICDVGRSRRCPCASPTASALHREGSYRSGKRFLCIATGWAPRISCRN